MKSFDQSSKVTANSVVQRKSQPTELIVDNRPSMVRQLAIQKVINNKQNHTGHLDVAQLFRKKTYKNQDGYFVPDIDSAIHCHVGGRIRDPHLKIRGERYEFGNPHNPRRMQEAYDALVGGDNQNLAGYADCVDYLLEEGCVATPIEEEVVAEVIPQAPKSAYEDPTTSRESRALIERGLDSGSYPPRR